MALRLIAVLFAILSAAALTGGCAGGSADEQQIPWGRPASWEGSGPGYGGF